jgi:hypothetical protein
MATKTPMLDMFKRVLPAIDTRDRSFLENLSEEEAKGFSPWLVMRYLSSAESSTNEVIEHYLLMTNAVVNKNFSDFSKDPELLWRLMCIVGVGKGFKHPYVAPPKGKRKKEKNAFKQWLAEQNPHLDKQELDIWFSSFTKESALDLLEQFQIKNKDIISSTNDI